MTNEEKINLIGKKILLLSNDLEKYRSELEQLRADLKKLQEAGSPIQTPVPQTEKAIVPELETKPVLQETTVEKDTTVKEEMKHVAAPKITEPKATGKGFNFEEFIGAKLITIIGVAVLVIGLGIGVKYAIDKDLITPLTRIVLAYVAGGILLALALKLKEKFKTFSAVLLSGGMASLYFTTYAAYSMYGLFPQMAAFAIMVIFTAFTVFAAMVYSLQVIGIIGLVGAYFVPVLLSDGSGKIEIMFSYMTIINAGIVFLSFKRDWKILNHTAFVLTWLIYSIWYLDKFDYEKHTLLASVFAFLFFLIFYTSTMAYKLMKGEKMGAMDVIRLVSNSFIFFGFGYATLDHGSGSNFLGLFTVANALVHLVFSYLVFRNKILDRNLFYFLIALVLSFITIAVPVQLEGNWVTLFWVAEALILFYIGRTRTVGFYEVLSFVMIFFAVFSLWHDWSEYYDSWYFLDEIQKQRISFVNMQFFTSVFTTLSLASVLYYHFKHPITIEGKGKFRFYKVMEYVFSLLLFMLAYGSISNEITAFYQMRYEASHIKVPSTYAWAEPGLLVDVYDESWNYLKKAGLTIYNLVFFITFTLLTIKSWNNKILNWIVFSVNLLVALVFITGGLTEFAELRDYYLNPENATHFTLSHSAFYLRYIGIFLLSVLLWMTYKLLQSETFNKLMLHRYYIGSIVHLFILVLLCNEMTNIYHLNSERTEHFFRNLDAVYKLGYTMVFAAYSFGLIAFGIFKKNRIMRVSAIVLFGITLLKLVTFDTWDLSTGYKVIAYIILGVILLIVAFLYQKFKSVIFGDDSVTEN